MRQILDTLYSFGSFGQDIFYGNHLHGHNSKGANYITESINPNWVSWSLYSAKGHLVYQAFIEIYKLSYKYHPTSKEKER